MNRLSWRVGSGAIDCEPGVLMGIVNVTPDSFSDGGAYRDVDHVIRHAMRLVESGAHVIDIGGESTRPGALAVPAAEEIRRTVPAVEGLAERGVIVSIDTSKSVVARAAITAGASIVNDVTAGSDPKMFPLVAEESVGMVLMHMRGTPRTMQDAPHYEDVTTEVKSFLAERMDRAVGSGIHPEAIVLDPGIGFGKTVSHNLRLLRQSRSLTDLGRPLMIGTSRKSFLGSISGIKEPAARDQLTALTTAIGYVNGARVFRVHDVAASRDALSLAAAIVASQ